MPSRRSFLQTTVGAVTVPWMNPAGEARSAASDAFETESANVEGGRLFPDGLVPFRWQEFLATSYSHPVTGIIYRHRRGDMFFANPEARPRPVSGVPLGGIDTGGIYLEGSGSFGYTSIFNHYCPAGGPINAPYLGFSVGGRVWVMSRGLTKSYTGLNLPTLGPAMTMFDEHPPIGVSPADSIDYWGHYPIVDMQYKTGAPVGVSMRAWAPFLPGDSKVSNTPGAVFEIHLTNPTATRQSGTLVFSFPGFYEHRTRNELIGWTNLATKPVLPKPHVVRRGAPEGLSCTWVEDKAWGMSYVLAVLDEKNARLGGALGTDGSKWRAIEKALPTISEGSIDDGGSSLGVDFDLVPGQEKVIRIVLAWYAPEWEGNGNPGTGGHSAASEQVPDIVLGRGTTGKRFLHMYASRFADAGEVAKFLATNHQSLLKRIIAWQSVLYGEKDLPGWLADSLINAFYYFAPCSAWAQARPPIGNWCKPEDGLFALNESPRSCGHMSTFTNLAMAGPVLSMFFPDLALSSLRAFRATQKENGNIPQMLGLWMDVASPMGYGYQEATMGANYIVQLYWQWKGTGDDEFLKEFYPSAKRMLEYNFGLRPDLGPSQIIAMPATGDQREWFEDRKMYGYETHAGGYRLVAAEMMIEWAEKMGDTEYVGRLKAMVEAGQRAMEKYLW